MKILIVSDAWEPQVNGVVRTLKMTRRELELKGHRSELISPLGFRSLPCPTYPEISLALTTRREVERRIDDIAPDCLHIATAVVNDCDLIVSWNFKHLVNYKTISKVRVVNAINRYKEIGIVSPTMLVEGEEE